MCARFESPVYVVLLQFLNVKLCILQDGSEKQSVKSDSSVEPDSSPPSPKVSKYLSSVKCACS